MPHCQLQVQVHQRQPEHEPLNEYEWARLGISEQISARWYVRVLRRLQDGHQARGYEQEPLDAQDWDKQEQQ